VTILRAVADAIEPLKPMETLAADLVTAAPQAEFRFALGPSSP
jgi:hypothetical protein